MCVFLSLRIRAQEKAMTRIVEDSSSGAAITHPEEGITAPDVIG